LASFKPAVDLMWDGHDIWPLVAGEAPAAPRTLYWEGVQHRTAAIRRGDWKLLVHREGASMVELFDLARDPQEKNDLAGSHPQVVAELQGLLGQQARRDNDALPLDSK
jgi:arylsulfatase A-like enzyme